MNSLSIFLFALFSIAVISPYDIINTQPTTTFKNSAEYCNARYDFCVEYPENLFTSEIVTTNLDGVYLESLDQQVTLTAYGEYNVLNLNLEEQHRLLLEFLVKAHGTIDDHLTIFSENGFTSAIEIGEQQIQVKCQKFEDHYVSVVIRLKEKDNPIYQNLKDEINVTIII